MVDFAPKLSEGIRPVEVATAPSTTTGLLSVFSGLMPTKDPKEEPKPSLDDVKKQDRISYFNEITRAAQAKEQGNEAAARTIANKAYIGWYQKYGPEDGDVNSTFENFTGTPVNLAITGSAEDQSAIFNSEAFQNNLALAAASNPEADPQEQALQAIAMTKQSQANEAQILQFKQAKEVNWLQAEPTFQNYVTGVQQEAKMLISSIQSDKIIMPDEAQQLRALYQNKIEFMSKPEGVSNEDWNSFTQTNVEPLTQIIGGVIELGSQVGIAQDTKKAIEGIIGVLVNKGKIPSSILARTQTELGSGNPMGDFITLLNEIKDSGGVSQEMLDNLDLLKKGTLNDLFVLATDFENITTENFVTPSSTKDAALDNLAMEEFKSLSPSKKLNSVTTTANLLRPQNGSAGVLAADVDNLLLKVDLLDTSALQPEDLSKIFGQNFYATLNKINEANPEIATYLMTKATNITAKQVSNAYSALTGEASQFGLTFSNGAIVVDPSNASSRRAQEYVDKYFGGSWENAKASKGVPEGFSAGFDYIGGVSNTLLVDGYKNYIDTSSNMDTLQGRANKIANFEKMKNSMESRLPTAGIQSGAGAETTVDDFQLSYKLPDEVANDKPFMSKVMAVSQEFGFSPNDLLRVIEFETAKSWNPSIKNPNSTATGLIQFLESTAKGLGTSTAELAQMTRAEQMDYVADYLRPFKGRLKNFGDIYMAVHWPAGVGKDEGYVMYKKGSEEYNVNTVLDTNKDGTVTRGEALAAVIAGTGGGQMTTAFTGEAEQFLTEARQDITTALPPSGAMQSPVGTSTAAPAAAPADATAAMPEQITENATAPAQGQPAAPTGDVVTVSPEAQALLDSLNETADKSFESEEELNQAVSSGQVEAGDVVVVGSSVYLISKGGKAQKIGG